MPEYFKTSKPRHAEIKGHERIPGIGRQYVDSCLPVRRLFDRKSSCLENASGQFTRDRIIIDDQNARPIRYALGRVIAFAQNSLDLCKRGIADHHMSQCNGADGPHAVPLRRALQFDGGCMFCQLFLEVRVVHEYFVERNATEVARFPAFPASDGATRLPNSEGAFQSDGSRVPLLRLRD